jgi:site-specific DNA recombinase
MMGPLAHILKNRFYIGEITYRGEVHEGEHPPIIDKELFLAVQAKLQESAVDRRVRRSRSPSFLSGLICDDRDNRMSPSHANKRGVRYRYYVSQAVLQNRKTQAGSITRASAPDVESSSSRRPASVRGSRAEQPLAYVAADGNGVSQLRTSLQASRTRSRLRGSRAARRFQNAPQRPAPETAPKSASTRVRHGRETGCLRLTPASVALFGASGDAP